MTQERESIRRQTTGGDPRDGPPGPPSGRRGQPDGGSRRALWEHEAPAVASEVSTLRNGVVGAAERAGATQGQRADVALAVSEALSNVVNHAYASHPAPGPMHVGVTYDGTSLHVLVSDDGDGMRPRVDSAGAGLGLAMISALASELMMSAGPGGTGTRVAMRFALR